MIAICAVLLYTNWIVTSLKPYIQCLSEEKHKMIINIKAINNNVCAGLLYVCGKVCVIAIMNGFFFVFSYSIVAINRACEWRFVNLQTNHHTHFSPAV